MKKILNHYLSGGTLVSPEGHTLNRVSGQAEFVGELGKIIIDEPDLQIKILSERDWEIQREPGVYRVAYKIDGIRLFVWTGMFWTDPEDGKEVSDPTRVIERVEAEPKHPTQARDVQEIRELKIQLEQLKTDKIDNKYPTVMDRLKQMAGGFVPDWDDENQTKWYILHENSIKEWSVGFVTTTKSPGVVYFRTAHDAQAAIDELGEELRG